MFKRLSFVFAMLLGLTSLVNAQETSTFEAAPCPVNVPFGFVEDTGAGGIECGFVTVPEFHAEPDGNQIRVAVAIINSNSPNPEPDPVFMEQGGPGGSTIELFMQLAPLFAPILAERDVILVEQRGTKFSEPNLDCPEVEQLTIDTISDDIEFDEALALQDQAYQACFDRLEGDGVNLSAFNSVENAADMISVADALGYEQINFYGVSYGTMLGQHLLRDFEDRLRSVVFDAVVPLELNFLPDIIATTDEGLTVVFDQCANNESCNERYPDLETTLFDTVSDLNENPVLVPIYDSETGESYDAFFNGDILLQLLRSLQYTTEFVPSLPAFIDATANGDYAWVERLYGLIIFQASRGSAEAMFTSVVCAEDADFTDADITTENVRPALLDGFRISVEGFQRACELIGVDQLDDYVDEPVRSDIPALLTTGEFDPVTPPRYAAVLEQYLPNSTNLVFPAVGHGVLLGGACPVSVIADFISDPEGDLNTSCIDNLAINFHQFTTDPSGQLQFPLPRDLNDVSEDFARYENEAGDIVVSIIASEEDDYDAAIEEALNTTVREGFSTPPLFTATQEDSFGEVVNSIYQDGTDFVLTYAFTVQEVIAVVVMEFPPAQINAIDPILIPLASNMFYID
ncbi:MAG: alpha/beta hydrolase [Anaerolineae bacterium]